MKAKNLITGCWGEAIAGDYLKNKGYEIIEANYRTKYAEIDLIVRDKRTLVFVEVRTRIGERLGLPEETLKPRKIKKLIRNAAAYVWLKGYRGLYRIDAVCILLYENRNLKRISHYQNITMDVNCGTKT